MVAPVVTPSGERVDREPLGRDGRPRLVLPRVSAPASAPRWVSGVFAGAQAALLSLLVVVVPALAAYVATSADPTNADVGWPRAAAVGTGLWLMGHGATVGIGGTVVTLVPLGVTALALFAAYASARRSAHRDVGAWLAGIGSYAGLVCLAVLAAGSAGPLGAGGPALARTALGALVVPALGLGLGTVRVRALRVATARVWTPVPVLVRRGALGGAVATASLVGVAALLTGTWVLSGRAATGDVVAGLGVDTFGGALLAVAQLAVAPNLVLWALAWLVGPGFAVGAGTVFSPAEVVSAPLPALPLLGALPTADGAGGPWRWAPVVVVGAGAVAGWWLHRRLPAGPTWHPAAAAGATGLSAGLLVAALTLLAGGGMGPGRLGVVGGSAPLVGGVAALLVTAGALLVAVPADAGVRSAVAGRSRAAGARAVRVVRRSPED